MKNLLVGQSGGPTAVINASLGGVISAASLHSQEIGRRYGMRNGIEGFLKGNIIDLTGMSGKDVEDILNRKSGLLGVSGVSNDARDVTKAAAEGNYRAQLALDILVHGIKKHIGSYVAEMNGIDVLVFTAGLGENDIALRQRVCENMDFFGIAVDPEKNNVRGEARDISADGARVRTFVIPTDEEYMIALDTEALAR